MRFKFEFEKSGETFIISGKTKNGNLIEKVMQISYKMVGYSEQRAREETKKTMELLK